MNETASRRRPDERGRRHQLRIFPLIWQGLLLVSCWISSCIGQDVPTVAPTDVPSIARAPTITPVSEAEPTFAPTTATFAPTTATPAAEPSFGPTPSPSVSISPTSPVPTDVPSISPSHSPSTIPTETLQPSLSPSDGPTSIPTRMPSDRPSEVPSDSPSGSPTISIAPSSLPSVSPSVYPSASMAPSSRPSVSAKPTQSSEPSASPSSQPSTDAPSQAPSPFPSQSPSKLPSQSPSLAPSQAPTPKTTFLGPTTLQMELIGMEDIFSAGQVPTWNIITSEFVKDFWNGISFSPAFVGKVETAFKSQVWVNVSTASPERVRRKLQAELGNSTVRLLQISYDQNISYAATEPVGPIYQPWPDELFLSPFDLDPITYTNAMIELTGNNRSVHIYRVWITVAPTTPTASPIAAPTSSGKLAKRDRNIIISVTLVTFFVLLIAGGYVVYLVRKENMDGPEVAELNTPVDVIRDGDPYYIHAGASTPVGLSPSPSFGAHSLHSTHSEPGYPSTMSNSMESPNVEGENQKQDNEDSNFLVSNTSAPMAVIEDPDSIVQSAASGSLAADQAQAPDDNDEEVPPHAFSMTGFQMKIEDLDDV